MSRQRVERTIEPLDRYVAQTREFMDGWLLFGQVMSAFVQPNANRAQLENQFLRIKSNLARQHNVLKNKLGPDFRFDPNVIHILAGTPNLESLYSQSEVAVKKLQNEWHRAFISMNETLGNLEEKHRRALTGERLMAGTLLFHIPTRKPLPWRQIGLAAAAAAILVFAGGGYYVMRHFLGFWAPASGEGMVIADTMTDEERIRVTLETVRDAIHSADVDRMMTAYSDLYRDDDDQSKTDFRIMMQGLKTTGVLATARLDESQAEVRIDGDLATVGPVSFTSSEGDGRFMLVLAKEDGRWLISKVSGL